MVNWFTFLENQPVVDHEKHQRAGVCSLKMSTPKAGYRVGLAGGGRNKVRRRRIKVGQPQLLQL
jgi:hypothetical protein